VIDRVLEAILVVLLASVVVLAFAAVLFRYVLAASIPWAYEVLMALLVYITFLGSYVALRKNAHLRVDVLVRKLPPVGRTIVFVFNQLVIAGVSFVMLYWGARQAIRFARQTTIMLEIPVSILYVIIPICGTLMMLDALWVLVQGLRLAKQGHDPHTIRGEFDLENTRAEGDL
jgi:TRAP-type C4-dicarboxylate transport system permease small subunit